MQDMTETIIIHALKPGLYLVENEHKRRFLLVMSDDGIGQSFDLKDGDHMTSGKNILETLGIRRILKLSDRTFIEGDWFVRDSAGNLKLESDIAPLLEDVDEDAEDNFETSEAFNQCKIRPDVEEVKKRNDC